MVDFRQGGRAWVEKRGRGLDKFSLSVAFFHRFWGLNPAAFLNFAPRGKNVEKSLTSTFPAQLASTAGGDKATPHPHHAPTQEKRQEFINLFNTPSS